jgi:hypothetical protein
MRPAQATSLPHRPRKILDTKTVVAWQLADGSRDEIESHPAQGMEQWLYNHMEGVGNRVLVDFTDPKHTGDYRQTKDPAFHQ